MPESTSPKERSNCDQLSWLAEAVGVRQRYRELYKEKTDEIFAKWFIVANELNKFYGIIHQRDMS